MEKALLISLAVMASCSFSTMAEDLVLKSVQLQEPGYPASTTFMTYDQQGRLSKITSSDSQYESYVFDYAGIAENRIVYNYVNTQYPSDNEVYTVTLGSNGFAEKIEEKDAEGSVTIYTFTYNADGRMTQVDIRESGDEGPEIYDITYTDGSITEIVHTDKRDPADVDVDRITVTPSDIAAKGCLGMYDDIYNIDLDNADVASTAGLLGNSPAKLPAKMVEIGSEDKETYDYVWTTYDNGYPATVKITNTAEYQWGTEKYEDTYTFTWDTAAGIGSIATDANLPEAVYGIDGRLHNGLQPGINIVRHADGSVTKVLVK